MMYKRSLTITMMLFNLSAQAAERGPGVRSFLSGILNGLFRDTPQVDAGASRPEANPLTNPIDGSALVVARAFRDPAGNALVYFENGSGTRMLNLMFWGPRATNVLYQLKQEGFGGTSEDFEMSFSAGNETSAESPQIKISKAEPAVVTCAGRSHCFERLSDVETSALQHAVRIGALKLEGLPPIHAVEYAFKIYGSETYILVTSPKYDPSYNFKVFIGPKYDLGGVPVASVIRRRDGGTTEITLEDGRVIYSPSYFKEDAEPRIFSTKDDETGQVLVKLDTSAKFAIELGINPALLNASALETPVSGRNACPIFLTQSK